MSGVIFKNSDNQDFVFIEGDMGSVSYNEVLGDALTLTPSIEENNKTIVIAEKDYIKFYKLPEEILSTLQNRK